MSYKTEVETTKIAKRMAREAGKSEALWELFLTEAYREYHNLPVSQPSAPCQVCGGLAACWCDQASTGRDTNG